MLTTETLIPAFNAVQMEYSAMSLKDRGEYDRFFEATLNEYHGVISRVVSTYERDRSLQEELYQEISVALWKALAKFDHQSSLKTYILSIAHKRSVSHVAKHVKIPSTIEIDEMDFPGDQCPSQKLSQAQSIDRLMRAIFKLSITDRQIVTLALEGLSYQDISNILGITVSNVGVKLNRAKNKLNQCMALETGV